MKFRTESSVSDDAGNSVVVWRVDARAAEDRVSVGTVVKCGREEHAMRTLGTIRVSKPSRFREYGEGLIRDPSEGEASTSVITDQRVDDPGDLREQQESGGCGRIHGKVLTMKRLNRKLVVQALLFVPIIVGLLLFVGLAALAFAEPSDIGSGGGTDNCMSPSDEKTLYGGEYKDLTLWRKLAARASLVGLKPGSESVAIAYTVPTNQVFSSVKENNLSEALGELIVRGKVGFARRGEDGLELVSSPEVLGALIVWDTVSEAGYWGDVWSSKPFDGDFYTHVVKEEAPTWLSKQDAVRTAMEEAGVSIDHWVGVWDSYPHVSAFEMQSPDVDFAELYADELGKLVTLAVDDGVLGVCSDGRVITWEAVSTVPAIGAAVQADWKGATTPGSAAEGTSR